MTKIVVLLLFSFSGSFVILKGDAEEYCVSKSEDFKKVLTWNPYIADKGTEINFRYLCGSLKLINKIN